MYNINRTHHSASIFAVKLIISPSPKVATSMASMSSWKPSSLKRPEASLWILRFRSRQWRWWDHGGFRGKMLGIRSENVGSMGLLYCFYRDDYSITQPMFWGIRYGFTDGLRTSFQDLMGMKPWYLRFDGLFLRITTGETEKILLSCKRLHKNMDKHHCLWN